MSVHPSKSYYTHHTHHSIIFNIIDHSTVPTHLEKKHARTFQWHIHSVTHASTLKSVEHKSIHQCNG